MSDLPEGWIETKLGDIAEIRHGYAFQSKDFGKTGPIVLTPGNFTGDGKLDFQNKRVVRLNADFHNQWVLKNGSLLVVMTDLSQKKLILGAACILQTQEIVLHNQRIGLVIPFSKELSHFYLRYVILNHRFKKYIDSTATGTLITHTSPTKLLNGLIPLAPLNEQKRIADKLDRLLTRVDACRERCDRIPLILKRFRQSVLAAATSGELTEDWAGSSEEWATYALGELLSDIRYGTAKKTSYEGGGNVPVIRIPNIQNGLIDTHDLKYAQFDNREIETLELREGDVLIIRSNGSVDLVGKAAVVGSEIQGYLFAGYLIRLRLKTELITPQYLYFFLSSPSTRQHIELTARSTSGVNNINSEEIRAIEVDLPSLEDV
jgi:type I restriction enzyme, S subunit